MPNEGQQIGAYTLIRQLGKGGFGEVWLAEKRSQFVTKRVAVKLPFEDQVNLDAIRQEAELWEQASGHANVLPIIDADIYDGQVIIVSEYAEGGSLHDHLKRDGKLSIKRAVGMAVGILNGLEFLHKKRIIHRDIKPQNILLQGDTPRLADFGISRAMQTAAITSTVIGTDAYMAPEAFDGKRSIQTDLWSVAVVLYQLLTGNLPFPQEHPSERMFAILQKEFCPLPDEIPAQLRHIVSRAMEKLPENRYQSAGQMRDELQQLLFELSTASHSREAVTEILPTMSVPPTQFYNPNIIVNPEPTERPRELTAKSDSVATRFATVPEPQFGSQSTETPFRVVTVAGLILIVAVGLISVGSFIYSAARSKIGSATKLNSTPDVSFSPERVPSVNPNKSTGIPDKKVSPSRNAANDAQNSASFSNASAANASTTEIQKTSVLVGVFGESKSGLGGIPAKVVIFVGGQILSATANRSGYARFNEVSCDRQVTVSIIVEGEKSEFKRFLKCGLNKVTEWTYVSPYADSENTPSMEQRK